MKNSIKITLIIIGTLIGAGFASGQEIYIFFFSHGIKGILGIIISSALIGIAINKTLQIVHKYEINTYKDFLNTLIKNNTKIKTIINIIINIFILITFFIMIAGFGAYMEQELKINSLIGSGILATITFIIFMRNIKGLVKANEIIVPILIGLISIIGIINLKELLTGNIQNNLIETSKTKYYINAILYSSYNSILLIPVLITLKNYIKDKKQIKQITIISTIIISILSIIIYLLLIQVDTDITKLEMPAVYVVSNMHKILKYIYGLIILGSIFTTTISLGTSFLQNTATNKKSYTQIATIICIMSILVSKIGFSNLVNLLYPIFGYIGILQIIKIIFTKT